MKRLTTLLLVITLSSFAFSQTAQQRPAHAGDRLRVELRSSSDKIRLEDDVFLTVVFRSSLPVTLWNAFGWNSQTGLYLQVLDSSDHELKRFTQLFDLVPPDPTGKGELVTIGGNTFVGFESRIMATDLFPRPGKYKLRCIYVPPLSRDYFRGNIIWGTGDGRIESPPFAVVVEK